MNWTCKVTILTYSFFGAYVPSASLTCTLIT